MQRDACRTLIPFLTCRGSLAIDACTRVTANIGNIRGSLAQAPAAAPLAKPYFLGMGRYGPTQRYF